MLRTHDAARPSVRNRCLLRNGIDRSGPCSPTCPSPRPTRHFSEFSSQSIRALTVRRSENGNWSIGKESSSWQLPANPGCSTRSRSTTTSRTGFADQKASSLLGIVRCNFGMVSTQWSMATSRHLLFLRPRIGTGRARTPTSSTGIECSWRLG